VYSSGSTKTDNIDDDAKPKKIRHAKPYQEGSLSPEMLGGGGRGAAVSGLRASRKGVGGLWRDRTALKRV
jgi:hypothetical protein